MFTIESLKKSFPRSPKNRAMTGLIPIALFNQFEKEIRDAGKDACKEYAGKFRVIYRGPRPRKFAAMTRRADAVGVLLYRV